jgi:lipopolysaccharide/colanic/teichoic acid biosynthesis glycosyltransferase
MFRKLMNRFYANYVKRPADLLVAAGLLFLLSPVLLVAIMALAITQHGQVFFFQERPGRHGKLFRIVKLQTMNNDTDENGALKTDEERLTRIGRFLCSSSVDELPQLWNVLRGDMSLIGPRPLLTEYLPLYSQEQARRHDVRPGITGWAQVHGRNAISWKHKFELDVWYVDHLTLLTDLKVLALTIHHVVMRTDISEGEASVVHFNGSN